MSERLTVLDSEVEQAVQLAKDFLQTAFSGETIYNVGLEEVRRDHDRVWQVTLGFSRPWDQPPTGNTLLDIAAATSRPRRVFKTFTVDLEKGKGVAIANRRDD